MTDSIIVALITGGLSFAAIVYQSAKTSDKTTAAIKTAQAVTDTKLESLTLEVREHNQFAQRIPVIEEQIKVINHRISDLEKGA